MLTNIIIVSTGEETFETIVFFSLLLLKLLMLLKI